MQYVLRTADHVLACLHVQHVLLGDNLPAAAQLAYGPTSQSILSISGVPELAEKGEVSVALGIENDKPKIIVNLERAKSEGHQLSADLLKLAKIIK